MLTGKAERSLPNFSEKLHNNYDYDYNTWNENKIFIVIFSATAAPTPASTNPFAAGSTGGGTRRIAKAARRLGGKRWFVPLFGPFRDSIDRHPYSLLRSCEDGVSVSLFSRTFVLFGKKLKQDPDSYCTVPPFRDTVSPFSNPVLLFRDTVFYSTVYCDGFVMNLWLKLAEKLTFLGDKASKMLNIRLNSSLFA